MRCILLVLGALVFGLKVLSAADPTPTPKPPPAMPSDITLSNGAVLHDVSVVRWNTDSVVLKHTGGADTVRFVYIAEPDRTAVLAFRAYYKNSAHAATSSETVIDRSVKGQVFVASKGGVSYKLGDVKVYLLSVNELPLFETNSATVHLSKPAAVAVTDADGYYSLTPPDEGEYFVFAKASRLANGQTEQYEWRQPLSGVDRHHVQLSVANLIDFADHKQVVFDDE